MFNDKFSPARGSAPIKAPRAKRGPSIADVAKEAGVSAQTVSRVSNGLSNVEEHARQGGTCHGVLGLPAQQGGPCPQERAVQVHRRHHCL